MGYRTFYNLCILENPTGIPDVRIITELRDSCEDAKYSFDDKGENLDETKQYDNDKDIAGFSKKYPEVVFELYGEGEESDDKWYKYFKNGKMQECPVTITYDSYDESKLMPVTCTTEEKEGGNTEIQRTR